MPRPNPTRPIAREVILAGRIAYERQARGWTYDNLASRMARVGCPINASALHKIEKSDPPRRITVDEFVALTQVFRLSMADLLRPPEQVVGKQFERLYERVSASAEALSFAHEDHYGALRDALAFCHEHRDELLGNEAVAPLVNWLVNAYAALVPDEESKARLDDMLVDRARGKM